MHRCLHNSAPRYLCDYCIRVANVATRSQLRSASRHQVVVPRYNTSTFGGPSLSLAQRSGTRCQTSSPTHRYRSTVSVASLKHSCFQIRSSVHSAFSAVLSNGPGGPGPRAPKRQGPQTADVLIFSSREISVTNCVLFTG